MRMKKSRLALLLLFLVIVLATIENFQVTVREVSLPSQQIPPTLAQLRIVHLSDLHFRKESRTTKFLISRIPELHPDLIVFTGDLVDAKTKDCSDLILMLQELRQTAPVICVPGNHEYWSGLHQHLLDEMNKIDVLYLCNEKASIWIEGHEITIIGLDDPAGDCLQDSMMFLNQSASVAGFTLLLAHRPEFFSDYCISGIDLVCSGHAHGGQFRIPWFGGVIAPDQGLFPPFTEGPYFQDNTAMIVSRGLGNSIIPFRIHNPPEIVLIELIPSKPF
jgi:uncharacterized protein